MSLYSSSPARNRTIDRSLVSTSAGQRSPIFYEAPRSMLHCLQGRPVSREGTFAKAPKHMGHRGGGLEEIPMYDLPLGIGCGIQGSHGVVNTAERWRELEDEASPGPIYYPQLPRSHAIAFGPAHMPRPEKKAQKNLRPLPQRSTSPETAVLEKRPHSRCTFGGRPKSPRAKTETLPALTKPAAAEKPQPKALLHPTFGQSILGRARDPEHSPGPGHFLNAAYVPSGPQWTVGRRMPQRDTGTPGPGAYRIVKAFKSGKPQCSTFARTSHNSIFVNFGVSAKGTDSPGPAVYSRMHMYR